uniref:dynamin-binding protein isoform X2 n=1 Tax=Myxine glutinosa TaxID=7769 RepID=UPI00358F9D37
MEAGSLVRAVFDFLPSVPEELCLFSGDLAFVLQIIDEFWILGKKDGVAGQFPLSFVELVPLPKATPSETICYCTQDFRPTTKDALPLSRGDVFIVDGDLDEVWVHAWMDDRQGMVPSSCVMELKLPASFNRSNGRKIEHSAPVHALGLARAIMGLSAQMAGELDFREGDVITVLSIPEEGWFEGEIDGRRGTFPEGFVELFPSSQSQSLGSDCFPQKASEVEDAQVIAEALYDFQAIEEGELNFRKGDLIREIDYVEDGWLEGEIRGFRGRFPVKFVEIKPQESVEMPEHHPLTEQNGEKLNLAENSGLNETRIAKRFKTLNGDSNSSKDFQKSLVQKNGISGSSNHDIGRICVCDEGVPLESTFSPSEDMNTTLPSSTTVRSCEETNDCYTSPACRFDVPPDERANVAPSSALRGGPDSVTSLRSFCYSTQSRKYGDNFGNANVEAENDRLKCTLQTDIQKSEPLPESMEKSAKAGKPSFSVPGDLDIKLTQQVLQFDMSLTGSRTGLALAGENFYGQNLTPTLWQWEQNGVTLPPTLPPDLRPRAHRAAPPVPVTRCGSSPQTVPCCTSEVVEHNLFSSLLPGIETCASAGTGCHGAHPINLIQSQTEDQDGLWTQESNTRSQAKPGPEAQHEPDALQRMMDKRVKILAELHQTERDYFQDMQLCLQHFLLPLRAQQLPGLDLPCLFGNLEDVIEMSSRLLVALQHVLCQHPEKQLVGEVFLSCNDELESVYKAYCQNHDDAISLLEIYEKNSDVSAAIENCLSVIRRQTPCISLGALLIEPVQRLMRYPLLLAELLESTPDTHEDLAMLSRALSAMRIANGNINEFKRRKDLVLKYRKDDDFSLIGMLSKLNMRSIVKKSTRVSGHLKHLTGLASQIKDETFEEEEKKFRNFEKAVKSFIRNVSLFVQQVREEVVVEQSVSTAFTALHSGSSIERHLQACNVIADQLFPHLKEQVEHLVTNPLVALLAAFSGPRKLIQKRFDKYLDYSNRLEGERDRSRDRRSGVDELQAAQKDYAALNAQLLEELPPLVSAGQAMLQLTMLHLVAITGRFQCTALQQLQPLAQSLDLPVRTKGGIPSASLHRFSFVGDMHRLSSEGRKGSVTDRRLDTTTKSLLSGGGEPGDVRRATLLNRFPPQLMFQVDRPVCAAQAMDLSLAEGELVGVIKQQDPMGSNNRWFVDNGRIRLLVLSATIRPSYRSKPR